MQLAIQDVEIRTRAYAIWEEEGRPHGRDCEHWHRAAQELAAREPAPMIAAGPTAKGKPRKAAGAKGRLRRTLKSVLS